MLLQQKISNDNNFPDVERAISIIGIIINSDLAVFDLYYKIIYTRNKEDISNRFNSQIPQWSIDNTQKMMVRDENFNPMPNPEFNEIQNDQGIILNEEERFQTMPAFDYIKMLMLDINIPLKAILSSYISEEDKEGRFNF